MSSRYRGRKSGRRLIIILAVLFLVAAIGTALSIFVLPEFLVYSDDGKVTLDIPFLTKLFEPPKPEASPPPEASVNIIVVTPTPDVTGSQTPAPSPTPSPVPKALWVPQTVLADTAKLSSLKELCEASALNMLVLDVKNDEGIVAEPAVLAAAVSTLKTEGITVVGRLSCFMDNTLSRKSAVYGVKHTSGVNWLDNNRMRWLNPYKDEVLQYITECIKTAGAAGFDALLLDNLNFPYEGKLTALNYGADGIASHSAAIGIFLDCLDSMDGLDVPLYAVAASQTLSDGMQAEGGQDLQRFSRSFDRLFVRVPLSGAAEYFDAVLGGPGPEDIYAKDRLVPIVGVPTPAGGASPSESLRALLGAAGGSKGYGFLVVDGSADYPIGAFE